MMTIVKRLCIVAAMTVKVLINVDTKIVIILVLGMIIKMVCYGPR